MRNAADLGAQLREATEAGFRERLLARGQAQSMIRRGGTLPDDSPRFSQYLDQDLLEYGYVLMSNALRIVEAGRAADSDASDPSDVTEQQPIAREAFLQASYALEAATRNADPARPDLAFHRLIAGAASHLAGYAARAYSLMEASRSSGRLSPVELTLADLVMRDLSRIEDRALRVRSSARLTDEALVTAFSAAEDSAVDAIDDTTSDNDSTPSASEDAPLDTETLDDLGPLTLLLSEHYLSAVSAALFAISYGRRGVLDAALADLRLGEDAANDIAAPGPWWVFRLTRHLVEDLYDTSVRQHVPSELPGGVAGAADTDGRSLHPGSNEAENGPRPWRWLRETFVSVLLARRRAEIDLWPSQLNVVERIFAATDDLVVALPTSAGKTRIAELCILRCVAQGRRAVYVTPLRALSAQSERILEQTFAPLGLRVSSLYGSMGVNDLDDDALRSSEIVVATPEKLDFALRSDPSVLDVGVVVLDEGHMIGAGEREVRYESQIQRLLHRDDADTRRIVCLSAVFPDDEDLDDFVDWITDDTPSGLHQENWRSTRQQFGLVEWRAPSHARLTVTSGQDQPFIPRYFEASQPTGRRRRAFPQNQNELTIATAWQLVQEDQTVLIFCPFRASVTTLAALIVKLHRQGLIESVMPEGVDIANALAVGAEWFGPDHDILKCLRLGVGIHHGALPGPFRREIEALLHARSLKMTVASPTLAQGLNLSASVLLFSGLFRNGTLLSGAEFANVIGRAGRAFVDTEGLVLFPLFEPTEYRRGQWHQLTEGERSRTLQSGLISLGTDLLTRAIAAYGAAAVPQFLAYLTGGAECTLPVVPGESVGDRDAAAAAWASNLSMLDMALLSVVGDEEVAADEIIQALADAMRDSLWERQMRRLSEDRARQLRAIVQARAQRLWSSSTAAQRRGWYLAGLGADAGLELANAAPAIVDATIAAEAAMVGDATADAVSALVRLAALVFDVSTFENTVKVDDWRAVLRHWLAGDPLSEIGGEGFEATEFIESDIVYRLVWGIEAARVYEAAQGNLSAELIGGLATATLEAGTLNRSAAIVLRSGFDHRSAAIKAVNDTGAVFEDAAGMRSWLRELGSELAADAMWPTEASHDAWMRFSRQVRLRRQRRWSGRRVVVEDVVWDDTPVEPGQWLRVTREDPEHVVIWTPGFDRFATARVRLAARREGLLHARVGSDGELTLHYRGPNDWLRQTTPMATED